MPPAGCRVHPAGLLPSAYLGELGGATSPQWDDDVLRAGAEAAYQAANWLELKGGLAAEKRQSSIGGLDYTYRQVLLTAIARF